MKHIALIPAKKNSTRCPNKNWRDFINGCCLVDFVLRTIPTGLFDTVIVSTDKENYKVPEGIKKHLRDKNLSDRDSHIEDLIQLIIHEYAIGDEDYLWLLNPTTPFRLEGDYRCIARIIEENAPVAVISAVKILPFIWRDGTPLFKTKGKRRNTQDFVEQFFVENGMFVAMNAGHFCKFNSWYGKDVILYKQDKIWCFVDIDTEDDFPQAQKMGEVFLFSNNPVDTFYCTKRKDDRGG